MGEGFLQEQTRRNFRGTTLIQLLCEEPELFNLGTGMNAGPASPPAGAAQRAWASPGRKKKG